jgi:PAS domain S-box-containing protein
MTKTILVLDDDTVNRQLLVTLLGYQDYRLLESSLAAEALALARAERPDLIISDVLMPQMDGYEFVRRLRDDPDIASTRVIFYTAAYQEHEARALADACGVARVLTKPAEPETILDVVRSVLGIEAQDHPAAPVFFEREHTRLLTDKLFEKVRELEESNSSLRASEAQYRLLFESSPLPGWIIDLESFSFQAVNDAALQHYGYSREEFLRMTTLDIRPSGEVPRLISKLRASQDDSITQSGPWTHRLKDGTLIEVETFTQLINFEGRPARLILVEDITERSRNETKLRESEQQLRELAGHLQHAREAERTRVARDLHDVLGQALTAIKMNVTWVLARLPDVQREVAQMLKGSVDLVDETIVTVRRLSADLRPGILDLGLLAAIEWQAEEFQNRSDTACILDVSGEIDLLDPGTATEVFRIFQEILTNIARHAGATQVDVSLRQEAGALVLEVRDNGRGTTDEELNSRHALGILGMRERAALIGAALAIHGEPGCGTTVQLRVPVNREMAARADRV